MAPRPRTLVALHAHPDDEAIYTGGLLIRAARAGWRCVVIVATSGEGGRDAGIDDLGVVRRAETLAAAKLLGVARVEFLGYRDSGMVGSVPPAGALATADAGEVRQRTQEILDEETPELVLSYDDGGVYGHPDHVAVHQLGRVLDVAGSLYEATIERTELADLRTRWLDRGMPDHVWPEHLGADIGMDHPGLIRLDVEPELMIKQQAVSAHGSQVIEADSFMGLPPGVFHQLLATEWYHWVSGPGCELLRPMTAVESWTPGARGANGRS